MTPRLRKLLLTAHITISVGWLGAAAAFLALAIMGLTSPDAQMMRTSYVAMKLIARFVIVPLAFGSLLTGIVESLGTPWGLLRHYWVLAKLLLTTFATIVLLTKMPLIGYAACRAAETTSSLSLDLRAAGTQLAVHAAGGLLVLLAITALSVYKPWGLTQYGLRKREERQDETRRSRRSVGVKAVFDPAIATVGNSRSRWLRISLAAGAFVVAVHISMYHTGHGFHHGHRSERLFREIRTK